MSSRKTDKNRPTYIKRWMTWDTSLENELKKDYKEVRVYVKDGWLTQDFNLDRINIELSKNGKVNYIWFG